MLLFKRILNFTRSNVAASEQRGAERHVVGSAVQFKVALTLLRHDAAGKADPRGRQGPDWTAKVMNLSTLGASVQLPAAAHAHHGEVCRFKLSLGDYHIDIPGKVAYFRTFPTHATCGVAFEFDFFEIRKAYLQLLEAVAIGASLAPVPAAEIKPDATGLDKEVYRGKDGAQLTVWRTEADGDISRFDFRMSDYGVRWSTGQTELETYASARKSSGGELTRAEHDEVSWLFCLAVPNLAKAVQSDVRKFLSSLIA
jgi:hypothetical protein